MPLEVEARISRLLDQLEDPDLSPQELAALKEKIEFLRTLKE